MSNPEISENWQRLRAHQARLATQPPGELFEQEPGRVDRLTLEVEDLAIDLSKHLIDAAALDELLGLARGANLDAWRQRLVTGAHVNTTEDRPALHMALRSQDRALLSVDGTDVADQVQRERARCRAFVERFGSGQLKGAGGKPLDNIVSIGIGGSLWGPALAVEALGGDSGKIKFVSSLDGTALRAALAACDPERTLVMVSSKSFTTQETLANADVAKRWLADTVGGPALGQMVAITANPGRARDLGYPPEQIFEFWDWVGGRYSLWSAIGLPAELLIGSEAYEQMLAGAAAMDNHFLTTDAERNAPLLLGLLDVWYASVWQCETTAVLPYEDALRLLPVYVQQLSMESNGKSTSREGTVVEVNTGPIVWGGTGNDAQHTFYQLLHQGSRMIPVEFLVAASDDSGLGQHRDALVANCLAQAEALMLGAQTGDPHRDCAGGRPSTTILFPRLTPRVLGALLALYEHRVFVQGVCWSINSFDQWGVELGKRLANRIGDEIKAGEAGEQHDPSTANLLGRYLKMRGG